MRNCGFETGVSLHGIDKEKDELEKEIKKELYHRDNVYQTEVLDDGNEYFKCSREWNQRNIHGRASSYPSQKTFYILVNEINSENEFHPVDKQRNELKWIKCSFESQGTCLIYIHGHGEDAEEYYLRQDQYWQEVEDFFPEILFNKGDKKSDINQRLIESLKKAVSKLTIDIEEVIKIIETKLDQFKKELETPFIPENIRNIALESVKKQLQEVKLRHRDCDRLENLIG